MKKFVVSLVLLFSGFSAQADEGLVLDKIINCDSTEKTPLGPNTVSTAVYSRFTVVLGQPKFKGNGPGREANSVVYLLGIVAEKRTYEVISLETAIDQYNFSEVNGDNLQITFNYRVDSEFVFGRATWTMADGKVFQYHCSLSN